VLVYYYVVSFVGCVWVPAPLVLYIKIN